MGAPADPGIRQDGWRVAGARKDDQDAIFALLKTEPTVVLGPEHDPSASWERMTALSSNPAAISVSHEGRGLALGVYDPHTGGLAVAVFGTLAHLGPRIEYVVHGDPSALEDLRRIVEEGPKGCAELEVEAEPTSPVADGTTPPHYFHVVVRRKDRS